MTNQKRSIIIVGYPCNLKCRICYIDYEKEMAEKTTDKIKEEILFSKKKGCEIIAFDGGEPTIRRDIFELANFAKEQEFKVIRIQTNAVKLADMSFTKKLVDSGVNFFKVSIHGHNAEIQDYISRVEGSFDKIVEGIKNLKKLGQSVEANIVINKANYRFLPQIVAYLIGLGISKFCITFIQLKGNALMNVDSTAIRLSKVIPYLKNALDITEDTNLDYCTTVNIPLCFMKDYENYVADYSDDFGEDRIMITTEGVEEGNLDDGIKVKACKSCKYFNKCTGIGPNYIKIFGDSEINPCTE